MSTSASFSKYGKPFQETLAHLILEDRPFADQMTEVLDINFFELKYLRVFINKVFQYKNKYDSQPTKKVISTILSG
jgi:hypothetical protein